jgi:hypothetical protein
MNTKHTRLKLLTAFLYGCFLCCAAYGGGPQAIISPPTGLQAHWQSPGRSQLPVERFAKRFQHEGLPIIRVWENRSMLVSVGVDPKGRPGLWLLQKAY